MRVTVSWVQIPLSPPGVIHLSTSLDFIFLFFYFLLIIFLLEFFYRSGEVQEPFGEFGRIRIVFRGGMETFRGVCSAPFHFIGLFYWLNSYFQLGKRV